MYQGSASYLWENYDAVFLDALIDQSVELEKNINEEAGVSSDNSNRKDSSPSRGKFGVHNLEDSPCSEEQYAKFLEIQALTTQKNAEKMKGRKVSGIKLTDDPSIAAKVKQMEQLIKYN